MSDIKRNNLPVDVLWSLAIDGVVTTIGNCNVRLRFNEDGSLKSVELNGSVLENTVYLHQLEMFISLLRGQDRRLFHCFSRDGSSDSGTATLVVLAADKREATKIAKKRLKSCGRQELVAGLHVEDTEPYYMWEDMQSRS